MQRPATKQADSLPNAHGPRCAERTMRPMADVEICVVGAGFAGLTAALAPQASGPIGGPLEARDRVGGRTFTVEGPKGIWTDRGGAWIEYGQDGIYGLLREFGVGSYKQYVDGEAMMVVDGKQYRHEGTIPLTMSTWAALNMGAVTRKMSAEIGDLVQHPPRTDAPRGPVAPAPAHPQRRRRADQHFVRRAVVAKGRFDGSVVRTGLVDEPDHRRIYGRAAPWGDVRDHRRSRSPQVHQDGPRRVAKNVVGQSRRALREQAASPLAYLDQDWSVERYSSDGMLSHCPPGVLTEFGPAIVEPCGRIHRAGTETSGVMHGWVDGAVRSGQRAANEVMALEPASVT